MLTKHLIFFFLFLIYNHYQKGGHFTLPKLCLIFSSVPSVLATEWHHPQQKIEKKKKEIKKESVSNPVNIIIQLLTIEALDMKWYRRENTDIDRDVGRYHIMSNFSLVNNCFIILCLKLKKKGSLISNSIKIPRFWKYA